MKLYVDGKRVAEATGFDANAYSLDNDQPLRIGFGQHEYFAGKMSDLRLYGRALEGEEVSALAG